MALKKSELYSSLWASCDELRGGMDASQYKDYVLVLLFIKYVSDKYAGQAYAPITLPEGASFKDMVALKGKPSIGDDINKRIIAPLANANKLSDMPDFNDATKLGSGKEMVDRLTNLIAIFESKALDFSKNRAEGDDILGDAYEYLMRHFATESGKSKGQFYTPAEVSRVMAQIIGIRNAKTSAATTVYDPTCGSGSLLLKVGEEAGTPVTLYGQEKDATTSGLARMNMILHDYATAEVVQGNTLADPKFKNGDTLKTFDYVVANPPFSDKRWSNGIDPLNDPFDRFKSFGTPPGKQGDYAYLLHIVRSLKSAGKGACILPHGVLFRGNAEADIRRNLVRKGYIKGIIGLPPNLFYGTGIPACIVIVDKEDAHARKGIFMIDASGGFMKDGPKNRLRSMDIHRIVDVFNKRLEVPGYARMVSVEEIEGNEFNLNLPRYIDSQTPEDVQDIAGHLQGGIPAADIDALQPYWKTLPGLRSALFLEAPRVTPAEHRHGLHSAYFETCFEYEGDKADWPSSFAILTAFATTGDDWTREQNEAADRRLADVLRERGSLICRVTGYSPNTNHAEPGWAATLDFDTACAIGRNFHQDAIYFVEGGTLFVSRSAEPQRVGVGAFRERVHPHGQHRFPRRGYVELAVDKSTIKSTIYTHPQFAAFIGCMNAHFDTWRQKSSASLKALQAGFHPKEVISGLAEDLLAHYAGKPLIDAYDVYQHLMDYWAETMQDDCYLIAADGWKAETTRIIEKDKKGREKDKGWICDLIPKSIIVARYFSKEHAAIDDLRAALESTTARLTEMDEEHGGEDGAFADLDKVNKANVAARLKEIKGDTESEDEAVALTAWLELNEVKAELKDRLKFAEAELDAQAYAKYPELAEAEIKTLVVDDEWLSRLDVVIHGELGRVSQQLTHRVSQLAERYETPLPQLAERAIDLEARVNRHMGLIGFVWK